MALIVSIDPDDLAESGWGLVVPRGIDPAILEALEPLIRRRRDEAGPRNAIYECERDESAIDFLSRHGVQLAAVDPHLIPYYLLLVGPPDQISFEFQQTLALQFAVGRISLTGPGEYAQYARSVVEAESQPRTDAIPSLVFGVQHRDDAWSRQAFDSIVQPIGEMMTGVRQTFDPERTDASADTKANLIQLLRGNPHRWRLMLTVSHGLVSEQDRRVHGAIVCQDWPGPGSRQPMSADWYFAASDVPDDAVLLGAITVHVSSFSAGDDGIGERPAAVSALAQRLLAHPAGTSLAFIGHVGRFWGLSIPGRSRREAECYRALLWALGRGSRAGHAMSAAGQTWASASARLVELRRSVTGPVADPVDAADAWITANSSRSLTLLGDPAVRLAKR